MYGPLQPLSVEVLARHPEHLVILNEVKDLVTACLSVRRYADTRFFADAQNDGA
jgi:hypothetical protein